MTHNKSAVQGEAVSLPGQPWMVGAALFVDLCGLLASWSLGSPAAIVACALLAVVMALLLCVRFRRASVCGPGVRLEVES